MNIGDVVEPISVRMTVKEVKDEGVICIWMTDDGHLNEALFPASQLRLVPDRLKSPSFGETLEKFAKLLYSEPPVPERVLLVGEQGT